MAFTTPLYIEHLGYGTHRATERPEKKLAAQVLELQQKLAAAKLEIEYLTAERDELITAIKEWSTDDWNDQLA